MQIDPSSDGAATAQPRPMSDERPSPQAGELPARLGHILCLDDFEEAARRHLPAPVFAYVSGGVERNQRCAPTRKRSSGYEFVTRVLVDTSKRSTQTQLFGRDWSAPFGIAPMGISALSAYRGDLVLAQAAAQENVPMIMSGSSLIRLEEIVQANPQAWFQAYLPGAETRSWP
jgi:L-lactate dehydrogenase (cytochrome)